MDKLTIPNDIKNWAVISCPIKGLRFDARTLALLDSDGDGRIRTDEVLAALDFLNSKGVSIADLSGDHASDLAALKVVEEKQSALEKLEPSELEKAALDEWESRGKDPKISLCGEGTEAANAALLSVEPIVDAFFEPAEDIPLVVEGPELELPLYAHLNPKHSDAIRKFAELCVKPVLGEVETLTRADWISVKNAFTPYREWASSRPTANASAKASLVDEERLLRFRIYLGEFLRNFVSIDALFEEKNQASFQVGTLRIDGKELALCFEVENEGAHSALSGKSGCCVIYLKIVRPADHLERQICSVVTAGTINGLYVGRNGVFYDRNGDNWEAVITQVVESQVSLAEAFWSPWRKLGETISGTVKKFLGDRQTQGFQTLQKSAAQPASNGATMASSVAAIGIGVGMIGASIASIAAAIRGMSPLQFLMTIIAIVLIVSLPSVILTWLKLRHRDLGAILNASGWAINHPIRFSMRQAARFTKCAKTSEWWLYALLLVLFAALIGWTVCLNFGGNFSTNNQTTKAPVVEPTPTEETK